MCTRFLSTREHHENPSSAVLSMISHSFSKSMGRTFFEHFCVVIVPQDCWREKDRKRSLNSLQKSFLQVSRNASCNTCMNCPVCRGLWDLFDPLRPDSPVLKCPMCDDLYQRLANRLGDRDRLLYFSHSILSKDMVVNFIEKIFGESKIKKIFILQTTAIPKNNPRESI